MRRARFLAGALRDLTELRLYLTRASGSLMVARTFTDQLRQRCRRIAELPGTLGQARPDLGETLRCVPHGDYVILFRYGSDILEIVRILHGRRDLPNALDEDPGT